MNCGVFTTWHVSSPFSQRVGAGTRVLKAVARDSGGVNMCSAVSTFEPR
jgi:hypothetical protein